MIVLEPVAARRDLACRLGADLAVDQLAGSATQALEANRVGRVGTVIECVGKIPTIEQAIGIVGYKSTVMMFGLMAPTEGLSVRPFLMFKKELALKASFINPCTQGRAVALTAGGKIDVSSMVLSEVALAELPAILADPARRAKGKAIVRPDF